LPPARSFVVPKRFTNLEERVFDGLHFERAADLEILDGRRDTVEILRAAILVCADGLQQMLTRERR